MRKPVVSIGVIVFAAASFAINAIPAHSAIAGVVINETESIVSGQPPKSRDRTVMIEGNKEKMIMDNREIITDLDKGTMFIVEPDKKTYVEMPFPPQGMMGQAAGGLAMHAMNFTKTGKSRTVAGNKCDEYSGAGKFAMGEYTIISCIASKAPGAEEFSKFQKAMMAKLKDTQMALTSNIPDGVPMAQDVTTQMHPFNMPNLPPEAAAQMKQQMANRPPTVTKSEVSKVESKKIASSEFEIPAGYTKQEMGMPMGMGPHGMQPGMAGSGAMGPHAMGTAGGMTGAPPPPVPAP